MEIRAFVAPASRRTVGEKKAALTRRRFPRRQTGMPSMLRLVGEIGGDARAGADDDADRQDFEHPVVAFERCGFAVARPFGLEDDLWRLAIVGPAGGDAFGALRRSAVEQHHVRVPGERLVEPVPDQAMVVEIEPAGEGDLGAGGNERFGLDAAFGGEKVAAVDHRRGQRAVGHRGTGAWPPGRAGVRLEAGGGRVAELFQALAPFDERRRPRRSGVRVRPSGFPSRPVPSGCVSAPPRWRRACAGSGPRRDGSC